MSDTESRLTSDTDTSDKEEPTLRRQTSTPKTSQQRLEELERTRGPVTRQKSKLRLETVKTPDVSIIGPQPEPTQKFLPTPPTTETGPGSSQSSLERTYRQFERTVPGTPSTYRLPIFSNPAQDPVRHPNRPFVLSPTGWWQQKPTPPPQKTPITPFSESITKTPPFLQRKRLFESLGVDLPHPDRHYGTRVKDPGWKEVVNDYNKNNMAEERNSNPPVPRRYIQKPDIFDGTSCSWNYIKRFLLICSNNGWDKHDDIKIQALTSSLRDAGLDWYTNLLEGRAEDAAPMSYAELEKAFLQAFRSPSLNKITAETRAMSRKQAIDEKTDVYLQAKRNLLLLWDPKITIERQIFYIIRGLKSNLIQPVTLLNPKTIEELVLALRRIEDAKVLEQASFETTLLVDTIDRVEQLKRVFTMTTLDTEGPTVQAAVPVQKLQSTRKCFRCGLETHLIRDCPQPSNPIRQARPLPRAPRTTWQQNRGPRPRQNQPFCPVHNVLGHSLIDCRLNQQQRNQNNQQNTLPYCSYHQSHLHSDIECRAQNPNVRLNAQAPRGGQRRLYGGIRNGLQLFVRNK